MSDASVVHVTSEVYATMKKLSETFAMVEDHTNINILPSQDKVIQTLRSEEGRMKSKNGGRITLRERGGSYSINKGFAKGDCSPLWTLYYIATRIVAAEELIAAQLAD